MSCIINLQEAETRLAPSKLASRQARKCRTAHSEKGCAGRYPSFVTNQLSNVLFSAIALLGPLSSTSPSFLLPTPAVVAI